MSIREMITKGEERTDTHMTYNAIAATSIPLKAKDGSSFSWVASTNQR